jgi:glycosyltransferase involved in cell wall biosynthesis
VSEPPRILFVAARYPWPANDGYRTRLANISLGLAQLGVVDVVGLSAEGVAHRIDPPSARINPVVVPEGVLPPALSRAWEFARGGLPSRLGRRIFADARPVIAELTSTHRYDLVWLSLPDTWEAVHDLLDAPVICDLDNLENLNSRARRALRPVWPEGGLGARVTVAARWASGRIVDRIDESRWDRLQRRAGHRCRHIVVCSPLDVGRSGCSNAVCVPNGYERRVDPAERRTEVGDSPVLGIVGLMSYPPNTDGARWFVREVMPSIRRELPGATLRIIGRGADVVADLGAMAGVEIVGEVDDMEVALRDVDIEVIPLRFGAGTRLKAVEAFANRLPVVSTTIGVEGLAVSHGRELLIADTPADLASAVVELCRDPGARVRLASNAEALYESDYRWSSIRDQVCELAGKVIERSGR